MKHNELMPDLISPGSHQKQSISVAPMSGMGNGSKKTVRADKLGT